MWWKWDDTNKKWQVSTDNVNFIDTVENFPLEAEFGKWIQHVGIAAPAVSPSGKGRIYFDSGLNKYRVSQHGAGYVDLISSFTSPLNTKGDIFTRDGSADARLGVGSDYKYLVAKAAETTGLLWFKPDYSKRKTSDQVVNNSTTLVDVTDISFPIAANEVWSFFICFFWTANSAADGKFAMSAPSGATGIWGAVTVGGAVSEVYDDTDPIILGSDGGGTINPDIIYGTVVNAGNAGTVKLRYAQSTAGANDCTFKAHSFIYARRHFD